MLYKKKWPLFIFLMPGLLFLLIFLYIPFVENIKNSFYDMSSVVRMPGQEWEFIGFYFVILLTGLAVTGALKVFDLPWVLSPNGAPQGLTHFLGTYMYQTAYGLNNYDYVSTQALLIVVLGVVVSKGVGFLTEDKEERHLKKLEKAKKRAEKHGQKFVRQEVA